MAKPAKPPATSTIYVRGFSPRTTSQDLSILFEDCGKVRSVTKSATDNFAYIEFEYPSGAKNAVRQFHGKEHDGYKLTVEAYYAKDGRESEPRRSPSPPPPSSHYRHASPSRSHTPRVVSSVDRYQPPIRPRDDSLDRAPSGHSTSSASSTPCYNCNGYGHLARDCPHPPRDPRYADTRGTLKKEYESGPLRDHRERDAPYTVRDTYAPSRTRSPPRESPPRAAPVTAPSASTAAFDSGDLANDRALFEEFLRFKKMMASALAPAAAAPATAPAPVTSAPAPVAQERVDHYAPSSSSRYSREPSPPPRGQSPRYDDRHSDRSRAAPRMDHYDAYSGQSTQSRQSRFEYVDREPEREVLPPRGYHDNGGGRGGYNNRGYQRTGYNQRGGHRGGYRGGERKLRDLDDESGRRV